MALISASNSPNIRSFHSKPISKNPNLCPFSLSFPLCKARLCAINTGSDEGGSVGNSRQAASYGADLLRKPVVASPPANDDDGSAKESSEDDESGKKSGDGDTWVDWEDQILEDTVPLVGFVRMILHSGKYESGDRLSPEHERMILERLLPYHPESEKKIGCGVDYITASLYKGRDGNRPGLPKLGTRSIEEILDSNLLQTQDPLDGPDWVPSKF
ncbi:protein DCL, chloroplastic isoform X2 [Sesamum indicum]|uniref:Protein DCL, chloroplastic isoform X2 n=1 Tax=Sesamum indicum TaxID=4182 RepID=A0A8M8UVC9_SESIN|nr:protein DCL, chloroplastic isoform X2 [Sesamum indicum]